MVMTSKIQRGYGLWFKKHCKQTQETPKCMGFKGVWVIPGMGYEGFNYTGYGNPQSNLLVYHVRPLADGEPRDRVTCQKWKVIS